MIRVIASGNVVSDAELKTFTGKSGDPFSILRFRVISSERDSNGNSIPTGINCEIRNTKRANALAPHLKKGTHVVLTGEYTERRSTNQQTGQTSYFNSVSVEKLEFTPSRQNQQGGNVYQNQSRQSAPAPQAPYAPQDNGFGDEPLPF